MFAAAYGKCDEGGGTLKVEIAGGALIHSPDPVIISGRRSRSRAAGKRAHFRLSLTHNFRLRSVTSQLCWV